MDKALEAEVRQRARGLCEYCRFPEALSELRHVVDHIIASQHRARRFPRTWLFAVAAAIFTKVPTSPALIPAARGSHACSTRARTIGRSISTGPVPVWLG